MHALNKWGNDPNSRTVAYYHRRVREVFAEKVAASGKRLERVEVVGLELAEERPELLIVRADDIVRELVQQRVDERRVRKEAAQVVRAQP